MVSIVCHLDIGTSSHIINLVFLISLAPPPCFDIFVIFVSFSCDGMPNLYCVVRSPGNIVAATPLVADANAIFPFVLTLASNAR